MSNQRRILRRGYAAAVLLLVLAALQLPATPAGARVVSHSMPRVTCVYARVNGARKCLRSGSFCSRTQSALRTYRRNGFMCTRRTRDGRWRLVRR